jgi:hypothetical protein
MRWEMQGRGTGFQLFPGPGKWPFTEAGTRPHFIEPRDKKALRFGNTALKDALTFSAADLDALKRFYSGPAFAWSGHRQALLGYLETGRMAKPCSAGYNTVFVRHTGEVFPCPLIPSSLGNIESANLQTMLSSSQAARFRKGIGSYPECQECTEPGLERIAWPFEGLTCLRALARMGQQDFSRFIAHMGLDKYL